VGRELAAYMRERLRPVRRSVAGLSAQGLLVTNMTNVRWLSGFTGSEAVLIIKQRSLHLLTDSRYLAQASRECKGYKIVQVSRRTDDLASVVRRLNIQRLAYEADGMTHARYLELKHAMKDVCMVRLKQGVAGLRAKKDARERRLIRRAADIAGRALREVLELVKPGAVESEVALRLETRMRELGSEETPFRTIVASGLRGAMPHGMASDKKIRKGELVTIDFGAVYKGYQSDQTVTVCAGRASRRQREIYQTVREARRMALGKMKPGVPCVEVDAAAREHIESRGYGKYFGHGLGHGVGLETHEAPVLAPRSRDVLQEGMVATVEPGIYIPGWGGVRIEDMVLVTRNGVEILTSSGGPLMEL